MFSQLHTYAGKGSFEGWIRRIIVHTSINFLKKHKKFNEYVDIDYAGDVSAREESLASIMQGRQIMDCIRQLPMGYRTVLNLYAIEGYSHKEIGELLEIGESTSRSQYTRARSMLEKLLIKEDRDYAFDFLKWKKAFELKQHWLAHTKKICPRCNIPLMKEHLGKTNRRTFYCNNCQVLYD